MKTHITREKGSITLGMVYGLGLLSLGIASLALSSVVTNLSTHKNEMSGVRTFVTADSAAREGAYRLITQSGFTGSADGVDLNSVEGGSIVLDMSAVPYIDVKGTAQNSLTSRTANYRVILENPSLAFLFEHAIYSQKTLTVGGSASASGSVYGLGLVDMDMTIAKTKDKCPIDGDIFSGGDVTFKNDDKKDGKKDEDETACVGKPDDEPPLNPFIKIDTDEYKKNACIGTTALDINWTTCTKVYLKAPSIDLNSSHIKSPFSGSIVVEGDLEMTGNIELSCTGYPDCSNPLTLYVEGNLTKVTGTPIINGIMIVTGDTNMASGNVTVNGSIISMGDVDVTGNITVNYKDWQTGGSWEYVGLLGTKTAVVGFVES